MSTVRACPGVTLEVRFRAATPRGEVIRPPASTKVVVSRLDGTQCHWEPPEPAWDGRQWVLAVDTAGWALGDYQILAEVSGEQGTGHARTVIELADRSW